MSTNCTKCGNAMEASARFCPRCGQPRSASSAVDPLIGAMLDGRYRVTSHIGKGGMATVYLARHEGLGRDVALKLLHPHVSSSHLAVQRFAREARATCRVSHDNVVHVHDFAFDRAYESYFLVMEHVPGVNLADAIERGAPFPLTRVLHVLAQVAVALRHCHQLGVIHRDLKSDNIILTRRGSDPDFVKILDFGLTLPLSGDPQLPRLSQATDVMGTPASMAPEQWLGRPADARTDVYALGVLAYEMITGTLPCDGDSALVLFNFHVQGELVPPSVRAPTAGITPSVDAFVARAMAKEPGDRFASMDEVLDALGKLWNEQPTAEARRTTYLGTSAAPKRRADSLSDPTIYESDRLDVAWDAPTLCEEIGRLHGLRARRFSELLEAVHPHGAPGGLEHARTQIEVLESELGRCSTEIGKLRAQLEADAHSGEEMEAALRSRILEASLVAGDLADSTDIYIPLPDEDDEDSTRPLERRAMAAQAAATDTDRERAHQSRRNAERRLGSFLRRQTRVRAVAEESVERLVGAMETTLRKLEPLYAELYGELSRQARKDETSRKHVREFAKVDGAIASYRSLLAALDVEYERAPPRR